MNLTKTASAAHYFDKAGEAAHTLRQMMSALEDGAEPDEVFIETFQDTKLALQEDVDRRIALFTMLEQAGDFHSSMRDQHGRIASQCKKWLAKLKKKTAEMIEKDPDLPYTGTDQVLAVKGKAPVLDTSFEVATKSVSSAFDPLDAPALYDLGFAEKVTLYKLKTKEIKAALKDGQDVPGCRLVKGKRLAIDTRKE